MIMNDDENDEMFNKLFPGTAIIIDDKKDYKRKYLLKFVKVS